MDMEEIQAGARALEEAESELIRLGGDIPPDLAVRIRDAHQRMNGMCLAWSEGMPCCVDLMFGVNDGS